MGYLDIPICNSLLRNSPIDCLNSLKLMLIVLPVYFIVLLSYNLCFLLNSKANDKIVRALCVISTTNSRSNDTLLLIQKHAETIAIKLK